MEISIFITVYNKEKYLNFVLKSIQNQSLRDFEIIFVDDFSSDNSVALIEGFMKEDPRITLIKNDKNRNVLFSYFQGVIHSKGEYLLSVDPDDMLANPRILEIAYYYAKKYEADILQFDRVMGNYSNLVYNYRPNKHRKELLKKPMINELFYREKKGKLNKSNRELWDKLVLRELYMEAMEELHDEIINKHLRMNYYSDMIVNFLLYKYASSYYYIDEIGYFYYRNEDSVWNINKNLTKKLANINNHFDFAFFVTQRLNNFNREKVLALYEFKLLGKEVLVYGNDVLYEKLLAFAEILRKESVLKEREMRTIDEILEGVENERKFRICTVNKFYLKGGLETEVLC